jgi:tRNA G18 (ribose-2'-O)-methylase SpoU
MRGYFGIGVERPTNPMNVGSLYRTANAFGASFVFTLGAAYARAEGRLADTSDASGALPLYEFRDADALKLPKGCALVGIELAEDATELPSFRHPRRAAYLLGSERAGLDAALMARCDHVVRIPTRFSVNLAVAGAIVMYDRLISLGKFARRPLVPGGKPEPVPAHVFGDPVIRTKRRQRTQRAGTNNR